MRRRKCVKCVRLKTFFSKIMLLMDAFIPGKSVSYDKVRSPARCWVNSLPKFGFGDGFASSRLQRFPRVEGARRGAGGGRFPRGQTDASVQLFQVCFSFSNVELRKAGSWPQAAVRVSRHGRHSISFECGTQELGKLGAGFGRGSSTSFNVELRKAGKGGSDSRMRTAP